MTGFALVQDADANDEVRAVFDEMRTLRRTDYVNDIWRALANHPPTLRRTWDQVKSVMGEPGPLDPLTRELIYIAVSVVNSCDYCIGTHTASARAKGATDEMLGQLLGIVATATLTNRLALGYGVELDERYRSPA